MPVRPQEDYLLRLIQQMVRALAEIAGLRNAGELDQAFDEVERATRTLLGDAADLLVRLDPGTAAQILGDPDRVLVWAKLVSEKAEILRLRGDGAGSRIETARAIALAREAAASGKPEAESLLEELTAGDPGSG
jgi:hypothetical protein